MIAAHASNPSRAAYASVQSDYAIAGCKIAAACERQAKRRTCYNAHLQLQEAEAQRANVIRCADFLIAFAEAHAEPQS